MAKNELSIVQKIAYSAGNLGVGLSPAIAVGWLMYFYTSGENISGVKFTSLAAFGVIAFIGRLMEPVSDPLIGYLSDSTRTRWGRRIPWMVFSTPLFAFSFIMLWFPPVNHPGWVNDTWLFVFNGLFWFSFTAYAAPYLALLPEISTINSERIKLSEGLAYAELSGMVLATIGVGFLIGHFKETPLHIGSKAFDGYSVMAVIVGVLLTIACFLPIIFIKEKPHSEEKEVPFKFFESIKLTMKNHSFPPYVYAISFFRIAVDLVVASIPFLVVSVLKKEESIAGSMQGGIIIGAAVLFPLVSWLADKYGKKKLMLLGFLLFALVMPLLGLTTVFPFLGKLGAPLLGLFGLPSTPENIMLLHVVLMFILAIFPIAINFVLPRAVFADIIDFDAEKTGFRREAIYNGVEGLISKFAAGVTSLISAGLFTYFGNTAQRPMGILLTGPVAGVLLFLGWWAFLKYPFKD